MRIVISHNAYAWFAGTETYMLTVALELERLGHDALLYAPQTGPMATFARRRGARVVDDDGELPPDVDGVLAQDAGTALALSERYPGARRLFVAHSDHYALQSPPQLDGVCHAVVVLNDRVRRFVEALARHPPVVRLRQPIDLRRFMPQGATSDRARRALLLDNYLEGPLVDKLDGACRDAGLELVHVGMPGTPTATPEHAIADADLVVGVGRGVLEAMGCGRAAYVYGQAGCDGWVTPERYPALEADGFGGLATADVIGRDRLAADLRDWQPEMGAANRLLAIAHHGVKSHAQQLVGLLGGPPALDPEAPTHAEELARLVRLEWQTWGMYRGAINGNRALREAVEAQHAELDRVHAAVAARDREIEQLQEVLERCRSERTEAIAAFEALRATRRVRWAQRIAAPLDALRRRR